MKEMLKNLVMVILVFGVLAGVMCGIEEYQYFLDQQEIELELDQQKINEEHIEENVTYYCPVVF